MTKLCTCLKCGWVHMAVSREYAERSVENFNDWFSKQSDKTKESYGGVGASIENYLGCFHCGGDQFREFEEGDCPSGVTIQPTIWEEV